MIVKTFRGENKNDKVSFLQHSKRTLGASFKEKKKRKRKWKK